MTLLFSLVALTPLSRAEPQGHVSLGARYTMWNSPRIRGYGTDDYTIDVEPGLFRIVDASVGVADASAPAARC